MVVAGCGRGWHRAARAGVIAVASVGLGALAHAATGACVPLTAAVGALVAVFGASWVLASAEAHLTTLLAWFGLTQVFVHYALTIGCTSRDGGLVHQTASHRTVAAHVITVAATAAALRVAEAGVWGAGRLRAGAGRLLRLLLGLVTTAMLVPLRRPQRMPRRGDLMRVPLLGPVLGACGRRGPPAALLAA